MALWIASFLYFSRRAEGEWLGPIVPTPEIPLSFVQATFIPIASKLPQEGPEAYKAYLRSLTKDSVLLEAIITCESNWHPLAANKGSTAKGLAQFLDSTWKSWGQGNVLDPYRNMEAMVRLYNARGTRPWDASKECWK